MKRKRFVSLILGVGIALVTFSSCKQVVAPAPLFIDPNYHGSCDPEIVWNEHDQSWYIYYTARRPALQNTWLRTPLGVIVSLQSLAGRRQPFRPVAQGNWRPVVSWALAAMVCGFFWEMWNMWSLARWEYTVPFVDRFHVFEMPLLGYAGYLPFGIECAAVTDFLTGPAESE